jgi:sugar/nucleoside kinase (ribokinase family)
MESDPDTRPVVLCVGMLTADLVQTVERMPGPNEKVPGLAQSLTFGGPAANAAATAAALGAEVHLVAGFGQSAFTPVVARLLDEAGVHWHDPAAGTPSPSPLSTVLITAGTGERAVVGGAAPPLPPSAVLPAALVETAHAVLLDGHAMPLAQAVARRARAAGIPVVFDGGSHKPGTDEVLAAVDLAILSADFHAPGGGDALNWVRECGCRFAARSDGPGPIRLRDDSGERCIVVPQVEIADTLGAGDVLHGAAAFAVARWGLDDPLRVLGYAAEVASLSCRYVGALGWAPHLR